MPRSDRAVAAALTVVVLVAYALTARDHPTPYDYFARLAEAFVSGRWWLVEAPSHLNELLPCGEGRSCVVYPPLPALATLPFLALFSPETAQTAASAFCAALATAPTFLALRRVGAPSGAATITTLLAALGTTLWFTSTDGRAWYFAHSAAVLCASLALLAALDARPPWLVGALLGAAALARPPLALAAPGLLLLDARRRGLPLPRALLLGALGALPFGVAFAGYDLLRFGSPLDTGYGPLLARDPYFTEGLFSLAYLPRHFYAMVMQAPEFVDTFPLFVRPNWVGVSLLLTSPALLFALAARGRPEVASLALAAVLPLALDVTYGTFGFAQFGYRYSLDAQPFALPLVAIGAAFRGGAWTRPPIAYLALVAWSVLANLYGVVAITFLGYVS